MGRKKNKPILIGVDLSIAEPGISIYNPTWIIKQQTSTYKFEKKDYPTNIERYNHVSDTLIKLYRNWPKENIKIMIEDYAAGGKGKTNAIAENGGIFKYKLVYEHDIEPENIMLCSISHLKMFVSSKGNAKKELMLKEVYKKWGYDTNNNNAADAYGLCMILKAMHYPDTMKTTSYQKEILERIIKYNKDNTI
ncbi:MAG: hypothetical protein GY870_08205 [archaeon]|nr:hypothetical protein [archaeon]